MNDLLSCVLLFFLICITGCKGAPPSITLSDDEKKLVRQLDYDEDITLHFKKEFGAIKVELRTFRQLNEDFREDDKMPPVGLYANFRRQNDWESVVQKAKSTFQSKGYNVFVMDTLCGADLPIGIIKGNDDLDIVRIRQTTGANINVYNEDIIKRLADWNSKYGIHVLGAGVDWVQISFDELPKNMDQFSKEVYQFCPDSVEQGTETVAALKREIIKCKAIFLWWD